MAVYREDACDMEEVAETLEVKEGYPVSAEEILCGIDHLVAGARCPKEAVPQFVNEPGEPGILVTKDHGHCSVAAGIGRQTRVGKRLSGGASQVEKILVTQEILLLEMFCAFHTKLRSRIEWDHGVDRESPPRMAANLLEKLLGPAFAHPNGSPSIVSGGAERT